MPKIPTPTSKKECNVLLNEIEQELVALFPEVLRKQGLQEAAYGILICYIDLTPESFTPFAAVLPEEHRAKCVANRDVGDLWMIAELPFIQCPLAKRHPIRGKCDAAYDYLSSDWDDQDEFEVILPFRKMIYRVCLALNKLDWSPYLPVTDDFTVMASDWSAGCYIHDDARASVPRAKQNSLLKKGFFFNPEALPKQKLPSKGSIKSILRSPVQEQVQFWIDQLESLYDNVDCEAKASNCGPKLIVKRLAKLDKLGAEALLQFVEDKASVPEWTTDQDPRSSWKYGTRSEVLGAAVDGIKESVVRNTKNEKRLWQVFETAVNTNKAAEHWGTLPGKIAFSIQDLFRSKGRRKYSYWVISDYRGQINSLAQIREQRRELGPA